MVFHEPVHRGPIQRARIVRRRDRQRVFVVLEDQTDDVVNSVDGFVNLMAFESSVVLLVENMHSSLQRILLFLSFLRHHSLLGLFISDNFRRGAAHRGSRCRLRAKRSIRFPSGTHGSLLRRDVLHL